MIVQVDTTTMVCNDHLGSRKVQFGASLEKVQVLADLSFDEERQQQKSALMASFLELCVGADHQRGQSGLAITIAVSVWFD